MGYSSEESVSKAQEVNSQPMEERPEKEGIACDATVTEQREVSL